MNHFKSISALQTSLKQGLTTCTEVVQHFIDIIETHPQYNIFLEVFKDEALARAKDIQEKINKGISGKLAGVVVALKDNIAYEGHKFSASSKMLLGFESLFSATVVTRLIEADAIIIGRVNCDEFAMGGSNENSAFGPVLNPINPAYVPGGSSGGSAAAVAAGMCHVALGTDTGGSIRQPAAFCGLVGMKPTYGRVSRHGIIAFASSFDQVGPITHNVTDNAIILEVIAGKDNFDSTMSQRPPTPFVPQSISEPFKIAIFAGLENHEGLHPAMAEAYMQTLERLQANGHQIVPIDFALLPYSIPTYYLLTTAEASSNLARYTGVGYGYRSKGATDLESTFKLSRSEGFGPEVKRRIMLGTFVLSEGYYDAYYAKAQKVRRILRDSLLAILNNADFILTPTSPGPAFKLNDKTADPLTMYLEDIFTVLANLTGLPAISIPVAVSEEQLPLGMQIMGKKFEEQKLYTFANNLVAYN